MCKIKQFTTSPVGNSVMSVEVQETFPSPHNIPELLYIKEVTRLLSGLVNRQLKWNMANFMTAMQFRKEHRTTTTSYLIFNSIKLKDNLQRR